MCVCVHDAAAAAVVYSGTVNTPCLKSQLFERLKQEDFLSPGVGYQLHNFLSLVS